MRGASWGVRREALDTLLEKTSPAKDLDKPLGERERTTLLVIIGALAKKAGMDIETHPTTAAKKIIPFVELLGTTLGRQTIERKLQLVPDAVEKHKTLKK